MKKSIIGILVLCLLVCFQSVFADGTCGTNVKYTVSGDTINFSRNDSAADAVWGTNCKTAITGNPAVTKITVSEPIRVTNAVAMFKDLSNITQMDLENLDVSGATDMYEMFKGCSSLRSLNVATWDTSNVTDMYEMFSGCRNLSRLNVSNWDTSKVVHMHGMFSECFYLSRPDVSSWDTSNVTDMSNMFLSCGYLINLDVSGWDTSNVTDMSGMFSGCYLNLLDVSRWDTSNVTNMASMFSSINDLFNLDVSGWDTSNVTDMSNMFSYCYNLRSLDVSGWDTSNVTNMSRMFYKCNNLINLDVGGWNTSKVINMSYMFYECEPLNSLDLSNWDTSKLQSWEDICYMFQSSEVTRFIFGENSLKGYINAMFSNFPRRNQRWYYIDAGPEASSPLPLGSFKENGELFNRYDPDTMAGTWAAISSVSMLTPAGVDITDQRVVTSDEICQLTVSVDPLAAPQKVEWASSRTSIAEVDSAGKVTFKAPGTVTITATAPNSGGIKAEMELTYSPSAPAISIRNTDNEDVTGQTLRITGDTIQLTGSVEPADGVFSTAWTVSDPGIAEVDVTGKVTFLTPGMVTAGYTVTAGDGTLQFALVKLTNQPLAEEVKIKDADGNDISGQTITVPTTEYQLSASALPAEAVQTFIWTSSDTSIASVDSAGSVTFKAAGNVRITAEAEGSGVSAWADFSVTFQAPVTILDPDGNDISGQTINVDTAEYQLKASHSFPSDSIHVIEWFSSDDNVAEVNYDSGLVAFKKAGTVQIHLSIGVYDGEGNIPGYGASVTLCYDPQIVTIQNSDGNDITGKQIAVNSAEYQLNAAASHSDPMPEFIWTSSNTDIAEVDQSGKVTFKEAWTWVTITAEAADGSGSSASVELYFERPNTEQIMILNPDGNDVSGQTFSVPTAEYQLSAAVIPAEAHANIYWESSDTYIAEVDSSGKVTFKELGNEVTITVLDDVSWKSVSVNISYDPPVSDVIRILDQDGNDISGQTITVDTAEYQLLSGAQTEPVPNFIWTSSDTDIAEVDATGKVTFKDDRRNVMITATADDGSGESTWMIISFEPPEIENIMILDPDGYDISGGYAAVHTAEYQLTAEVYPAGSAQNIIWESSDTDIAEVDRTGKVTFKEAWQEVTITAEAVGGWRWVSSGVDLTFAASSGTCGVNTAFSISDGTITFSGNGSGEAVWGNSCRAILDKDPDIRKIVFSDTVRVTDASYMFSGLSGIEEMNLAKLDVSGAEYFEGMFEGCISLTRLNVSGWGTSNAYDMSYMFYDCSSLDSLDLSTWNTSGVSNMYMMFYGCTNLSRLNVGGWNTSNVYNMTSMFYGCRSLESLDLSSWDTFNVTRMSAMFSNCSSLQSLNVSGWNTSGVTNMTNMFENCYLLDGLDVSGWNTSRVTNMYRLFMNCRALTSLDVSGWDVSKVTNISSIFNSCYSLISLDVSKWNTSLVKNMGSAFANCRSLKELNVSGWDTSSVTSFGSMFWNCFALTAFDAGSWNTSRATAMNQMFYNCTNLSSLNVSGWDTSQVTTMYQMFFNCGSLDRLDLSGWNPVNVTNLTDAFYGCYNISTLTLGKNTLQRNIFTSLPKYYASWYYIQPGSSASAPLKTGTEKKGVILFTGYDSKTMAGTWSINKNQKPLATAVKIQNSGGTDITGKTITSNAVSYQLKAAVSPAAAAQTVTWKSSDTAVAAVDKTGKVTFKKAGTVTITAAASDGSKKSASVKLKLLPAVTAITIKNSDGAVVTGKSVTSKTLTYQLKASATPAGAAQTVTWKSSDTAVAAVDKTGKVTFKKAGTVTITATSTDRGKKAATVKLTLLPKATKIIIRDPKGNKVNGKTVKVSTKTFKLSASALPAKAEQTVTWKSSDTSIATVNKNGKVTFKKAGIVKITVRSTDRGKKLGTVKLKYAP